MIATSPGLPKVTTPKVLLSFVGSIDRQCVYTTVGDVMALYNIHKSITPHLPDCDIAWAHDLLDLSDRCSRLKEINASDYSTMVFVCGPIHDAFRKLFRRFRASKRVAVGVSVTGDTDPYSYVSACYVRDSDAGMTFDLALADVGYPHRRWSGKRRKTAVSICLVGLQRLYGENDGSGQVEALVRQATEGLETKDVNTLLDLSRDDPLSVEADLQSAEAMITTRMHASLLAIYHGIPVVAIDQIRGGAKVTRHLSKIGYPVLNIWDLQPQDVSAALATVTADSFRETLVKAREEMIKQARGALEGARDLILREAM